MGARLIAATRSLTRVDPARTAVAQFCKDQVEQIVSHDGTGISGAQIGIESDSSLEE
jgi:hypothetical protein